MPTPKVFDPFAVPIELLASASRTADTELPDGSAAAHYQFTLKRRIAYDGKPLSPLRATFALSVQLSSASAALIETMEKKGAFSLMLSVPVGSDDDMRLLALKEKIDQSPSAPPTEERSR